MKLRELFEIWNINSDLAIFITDQDGNVLAREYNYAPFMDKDWIVTSIGSYDFGCYGTEQNHAVHIQVVVPEDIEKI